MGMLTELRARDPQAAARSAVMTLAIFAGVVSGLTKYQQPSVSPSASTVGWVTVLVLVAGVFEGPVLSSTLTVRELHSPAAMRTQVVMTAASLKFGGYALGSALAGHLVAADGGRAGVWFVAACQAAGVAVGCAALGWPVLRRRLSRPPSSGT